MPRDARRPRSLVGLLVLLVLTAPALLVAAGVQAPEEVKEDRWGPMSTPVPAAAVAQFEAAVVGYASLRGEVVAPLEEALALAPSYLLAHVYLGSILLLSTAVTKSHPVVQRAYAAARNLTRSTHLTDREAGHWAAFQALHDAGETPDFAAAARAWEGVLDAHPRDLLAIRSAHDAYIILGDTANLQASLARVLSRDWGTATDMEADHRYVRSMWSFALEENGDYARAAAVARKVLKEDPTDVTALHALAHTREMRSAKEEGEAMYKEFAGKWEVLRHSLFINHVAWHRAVFNLHLDGEHGTEKALALFDTFLVKDHGATGPATPLAMADAASLLWRLMLRGSLDRADARWATLRRFYAEGGYETAHVTGFNDLHMLMCLAVADPPAAQQALASMRRRAHAPAGRLARWVHRTLQGVPLEPTNVGVLSEVGISVGEAIVAFAQGDYGTAVRLLRDSRPSWIRVGGSHAQRDVLLLTLVEACLREETDLGLARALLAERASVKDPANEEGTWDRLAAVEARMQELGDAGKEEL